MDFGFGKIPRKLGNPWHGLVEHLGGGSHALTLDSNASVRAYTAPIQNIGAVWELKKPGIGAASTTPEESALGMEWRNWAFQPSGTNGKQVFFDAGGQPWWVVAMSFSVNGTAQTLDATFLLRPFGRLNGLSESALATLSITGLSVPGLTVSVSTWSLMSIKRQGNSMLIGFFENWDGYPAGDHAREMLGIVEISIGGTASYTPGAWPAGFTGLSLSATVVATTAECAAQSVVEVNTSSATETPCPDPPADPPESATYAYSGACHYRVKTTYPIWAWYVLDGSDQVPELVNVESWYESQSQITTTATCAEPDLITTSLSKSTEYSMWHRVFTSTDSIAGPVYHYSASVSGWEYVGDQIEITEQYTHQLDGETILAFSEIGDTITLGCIPGSMPYLARSLLLYSGGANRVPISFGPTICNANIIGLLKAVGNAVTYSSGMPTSTSTPIASCEFTGLLAVGGPHPGADGLTGQFNYSAVSGFWRCGYTQSLNAYDPVLNRHGGLKSNRSWYV
jgi:hypothetical protein